MKKAFLAICTIITVFLLIGNVYADSLEKEIITKEYTIDNLNKEEFYKSLSSKIEENDKKYHLKSVSETENQETLERNVEFEKSTIIQSNSISELLDTIDNQIDYEVDGYKGKVAIDENSINIQKNNSYTKEYKVYYEKKYYDLPTNDLINIPKTIKSNGIIYYLTNPIWYVAETKKVNGQDIPSRYNAVMQYEGIKKENVTTDYIATYQYKGIITKQVTSSITYKVQYIEIIEEKQNNILPIVATSSTGGIIFVCFIIFKMKNAKIYNYKEGKYKLIKLIYIKNSDVVIDLVNVRNTTNKFKIKLSNHLYNKLYDEKISFKYYDKIYRYRIEAKEFEITV